MLLLKMNVLITDDYHGDRHTAKKDCKKLLFLEIGWTTEKKFDFTSQVIFLSLMMSW